MAPRAMPRVAALSVLAAILFSALFAAQQSHPRVFWPWMTANVVILAGAAAVVDRGLALRVVMDFRGGMIRKMLIGLLSAAVLYLVFLAGNHLSRLLLPFAGAGVDSVYALKENLGPIRIALLMGFVIGPGEELFWRGYLQHALCMRFGGARGWLAATLLYAAVHAASGNVMLVAAALVAGAFWGWMYIRYRSIAANIISHAAWDLLVFLVLPFGP